MEAFRLIVLPALVLLFATTAILVRSTVRAERQLRVEHHDDLVQVATEITSLLDEVLRTQALLALSSDLVDYFVSRERFPRTEQYRPAPAAAALGVFQESRDVIAQAYIYHREWDRVLTGTGLVAPELFFVQERAYDAYDLDYWRDKSGGPNRSLELLPPTNRTTSSGVSRMVLPMVIHTIGNFASKEIFVIDLDHRWLGGLLRERRITRGSTIAVYDAEGELLMRSAGTPAIPEETGSGLLVEYSPRSPRLESLRYVAYVPASDVRGAARRDLWGGLAIVAVALAAALVASYAIAERIYSPIRQLIRLVGDPTPASRQMDSGEYEFLRSRITSLLDANREMEVEISSAMPVVLELYLIRLLNRGIVGETKNLRAFLQKHGLQFDSRFFRVAVVQLHTRPTGKPSAEQAEHSTVEPPTGAVFKLLATTLGSLCRYHILILDNTRLAVVTNFDDVNTAEMVGKRIGRLPEIFRDDVSMESFVGGLGRVHEELEGLCASYEEAIAALASANPFEFSVVTYDHEIEHGRRFFYSIEEETRAYSLLLSGDTASLVEHLHSIVDRNIAQDAGTESLRELYLQLYYTGLRVVYARNARPEEIMGTDFVPVEILSHQITGVQDIFSYILAFFREVSEYSRRVSRSKLEISELSGFVNEHFCEPIYLGSLAERFGTTEKYVSKMFKEQAGVSFHEYVATLRVNRARELLAKSSLPVGTILTKCGFTSRNTFMRTFKKLVGTTPTQYRHQAAGDG
jgi:AraC-like DNA-binding protein